MPNIDDYIPVLKLFGDNITSNHLLTTKGGKLTGNLSIGDNNVSNSLTLESSFNGGDDDGALGHYDSTSRLVLQSYQRAGTNSWGEIAHIQSYKWDSKQMIAYYMPDVYDRTTGDPISPLKAKVWIGAHAQATGQDSNHNHWEIETPDSKGYMRGRFTVDFAATTTQDGAASSNDPASPGLTLDKTYIATNQADFIVRTSYPTFQAGDTNVPTGPSKQSSLRLDGPAGLAQDIEFGRAYYNTARRWVIRNSADAETGSNAGAAFQIIRYDDSGTFINPAFHIDRKTGNIGLGTTSPTDILDINGNSIRLRTSKTPVSASDTGITGEICWDSSFLYICVATNTWKRTGLSSW